MPSRPRSSNSRFNRTILSVKSRNGAGRTVPSGNSSTIVPDCSTMKRRFVPSGAVSISSGWMRPSTNSCSFTLTPAHTGDAKNPARSTAIRSMRHVRCIIPPLVRWPNMSCGMRRALTSRQPGKLLRPTPGLRINSHVNQRRRTAGKRLLQRRAELFWRFDVVPLATERFDHFVITGIGDKGARGQRRVLGERRGATANTVVIEHDPGNGQLVAHCHFHLHAVKAKRGVPFQSNDALARVGDFRGNGNPRSDTHGAPGASIETMARFIVVQDLPTDVHGTRSLSDNDGVTRQGIL